MFRNPTTDMIIILVIVLLIFGPKRLPGLGKQLGQGIREFKDSVTGGDRDEDESPAQITPGPGAATGSARMNEQRSAERSASEHRS